MSCLTNLNLVLAASSVVFSVDSEAEVRKTAVASSEVCLVEVVMVRMVAAVVCLVVVAARVVEGCWDFELPWTSNV